MSIFTTHQGVIQDRINILLTVPELESLQDLAFACNVPIGSFIMKLASEHRQRLKLQATD